MIQIPLPLLRRYAFYRIGLVVRMARKYDLVPEGFDQAPNRIYAETFWAIRCRDDKMELSAGELDEWWLRIGVVKVTAPMLSRAAANKLIKISKLCVESMQRQLERRELGSTYAGLASIEDWTSDEYWDWE